MQRAKAFSYVCAGLFLLALSYHLGARSAQAQVGSTIVGFGVDGGNNNLVITSTGDVWYRCHDSGAGCITYTGPPVYVSNFWSGGAVSAEQHTLGQLKQRFRDPAPTRR